jgi:hypothetical protein
MHYIVPSNCEVYFYINIMLIPTPPKKVNFENQNITVRKVLAIEILRAPRSKLPLKFQDTSNWGSFSSDTTRTGLEPGKTKK